MKRYRQEIQKNSVVEPVINKTPSINVSTVEKRRLTPDIVQRKIDSIISKVFQRN